MGSIEEPTHFRTIQSFEPDYCATRFTQYESQRSGMRVVVVDQKGPKVWGYFVLATEIHDDSGAPHTLEHLCFMGSKSYQYKGFLDKLATRAYSSTNAWTANDHTAYTLETAGWAGFRQILPVYLEHVILPTLKDAACLTEVHHIDGQGLDAGVVYSEMQGVQNQADELMTLQAQRMMYPEGNGFRYETGGMMENLRVLTADKIRDFHRSMYQPKNLCLVLFGEIEHKELLRTLDEFEASIIHDIPDPASPFKRPWVESTPTPALTESIIKVVEFPEEDESLGQILIAFLGPDCTDSVEVAAGNVALLYLAGSSAALLDNTIVEKEQIASGVYFSVNLRPRTEVTFSLSGVETAKLEEVERRFFQILQDAMEKPLDMSFMQDCLERRIRSVKFNTESSPTAFADDIIIDYLFGRRDGSTLRETSTLSEYTKVLKSWNEEQWREFIKKYVSNAHHISILGKPSAKLAQQVKDQEALRIKEQVEKLGPEGLKRCTDQLDAAKAENDREIPHEDLAKFQVPSTDSIHFVNTPSARVGPARDIGPRPDSRYQPIIEKDTHHMPLFMDFEHISSNFARISLLISAEALPVELRPLIRIYLEGFFALPVERNGERIDFEQVVVELERDTVGYDVDTADHLGSPESFKVSIQVEIEKYSTAIDWLQELALHSVFDVERIRAINSRLLADMVENKRSGNGMLGSCWKMKMLTAESLSRAKCTLTQVLYLKRVKSLLATSPQTVVDELEAFRKALYRFENLRVLVIADLDKLRNPVSSWTSLARKFGLSDAAHPPALVPLTDPRTQITESGLRPGQASYIIPMAPIDSSFAYATARGPTSYLDPRVPAILVATSYLNATEGPLWVAVRGTGLAYGTSMSTDLDRGFISLDIYRSPDAYKAYLASKEIVRGHMDGTIPFDPLMLEGAISSIVVGFADEQATMASAATASFVRSLIRQLPDDYMQMILRQVRAITVDDIQKILREVLFDIFRHDKSDVYVTCAAGLVTQIKTGFESAGYQPEVKELTWFQDDYGLKRDDVEDGGEDDDEEQDESGDEDEDEEYD